METLNERSSGTSFLCYNIILYPPQYGGSEKTGLFRGSGVEVRFRRRTSKMRPYI